MTTSLVLQSQGGWRDYLALCKWRVVVLMLITVVVGMALASDTWPAASLIVGTLVGVGACAASAAAVNHWVDRKIDARMFRTQHRPVAAGRLSGREVLPFALGLGSVGFGVLWYWANPLTAWLTFATLVGYAGVYTGYLKRATTQNIVIGGLSGAVPPLLGWAAVTNTVSPFALLLVLIIFTWTPPHFWALAIDRFEEYQHAAVPMFPVVYGIETTKKMIFLYSVLLLLVSELPFLVGMSGDFYAIGALILGGRFLWKAWCLLKSPTHAFAKGLFWFSIVYLFVLFILMLCDHIGRLMW